MNDIERAVKLLKTINQNMKVDHMTKDMWEGATEEETREYIEDFGLINIAISALEKQIPKKPITIYDYVDDMDKHCCSRCELSPRVYKGEEYCTECGQRLDFGE